MGVGGGFAARRGYHVDVGVVGGVLGDAGADFEDFGVGAGAVLQAVAVALVGREAGAESPARKTSSPPSVTSVTSPDNT